MARLTLSNGDGDGHNIEPSTRSFRIGRSVESDLVLEHDTHASRHHARVTRQHDGWWIDDVGSRNGTWVNGEAVTNGRLHDGDRVRVGSTEFVFVDRFDPKMTEDYVAEEPAEPLPVLSVRERQILALVAEGSTDENIAASLFISTATVRSHLDRIRDKTGCRRRPELTRLALRLGLIR
jgi:pSer/pThr/pTyr-binding forkhead associated (FHA) protein